jgi:succinoglycan biosynthesis protein ExoM
VRTTISVAICTYNRNEALNTLLTALLDCAAKLAGRVAVGVVVVDDSSDGRARTIVEQFSDRFDLGIIYRISGRQNISLARNMAIESAMELAEWVAMTDDDCEPVPEWLEELLGVQRRTGADAVTGPMVRRVPAGSPSWLVDEPFLQLGLEESEDGAELTSASTFNALISSEWLKNHPTIRFQPSLGVVGGEDMVFYRAARSAGLQIRYAKRARVFENEPPSRATLAYQLRLFFWHGNSSSISSVQSGTSSFRMFLHGLKSLQQALVRPIFRICKGQRPQWRYSVASTLHAIGKLAGVMGLRVKHR